MTTTEAIQWLEELLNKFKDLRLTEEGCYDHGSAVGWLTEAQSALEAIVPTRHPVHKRWQILLQDTGPAPLGVGYVKVGMGIIRTTLDMVKNGRLDSLLDGIRAETEREVLGQADELANHSYCVAATVLASGALETHLRHLCNKNSLTWPGSGSISKYDKAIAQERNSGNEIYSKTDSKLVTAWGGMRNDAAHDPTTYSRTDAEVRTMIAGIRQFIARVP